MTSTELRRRLLASPLAALSVMGCVCGTCEAPMALRDGQTTQRALKLDPYQDPLVAGARYESTVEGQWVLEWDAAPLVLTDVTRVGPAVADATVAGDRLNIQAHKAGEATLMLSAEQGVSRQLDALKLRVIEPAAFVTGACYKTPLPPVYLAGASAVIPFHFLERAGGGAKLHGAGRYPVRVEPAGAARVNAELSDARALVLDVAPDAPAEIKLTSALPGDGGALSMQIIKSDAITRLKAFNPPATIRPGAQTHVFVAYATDEDRVVCSRLPYRIRHAPGDRMCTFEPLVALDRANDLYGAAASLLVEGVASGACQLLMEATLEGVEVAATSLDLWIGYPSGGGGWD